MTKREELEFGELFRDLAESLDGSVIPESMNRWYVESHEKRFVENELLKADVLGESVMGNAFREVLTFDPKRITKEQYLKYGKSMIFLPLYDEDV